MKENGFLASQLASRYELDEDVASLFELDASYAALTPASVQAAARKYLNPANVVKVVLVPERK